MGLLTLARDLRRRKARERHQLFVAEGIRAVEELVASPLTVHGALVSDSIDATPRGTSLRAALLARDVEVLHVDAKDFESASDTDTPQGVLAIARVPDRELASIPRDQPCRLLVLDALQDPGNVGTILRTAAAFGAHATVALVGTVDLWNAKVVRGAMGAHFRHHALTSTWDELRAFLASESIELWVAAAGGTPLDRVRAPERLALVVGNEGAGVTRPIRSAAARVVSLPLAAGVESLNVAVAAGVLLYELRIRPTL